jgi:hypothetical protein
MRVNISYSVELDDVPTEVERILIDCDKKIRMIHGDIEAAIGRDALSIIDDIHKIRLQLAATDIQLEDCKQILSGYIQTMARLPELEENNIVPETPPPEETIDD